MFLQKEKEVSMAEYVWYGRNGIERVVGGLAEMCEYWCTGVWSQI